MPKKIHDMPTATRPDIKVRPPNPTGAPESRAIQLHATMHFRQVASKMLPNRIQHGLSHKSGTRPVGKTLQNPVSTRHADPVSPRSSKPELLQALSRHALKHKTTRTRESLHFAKCLRSHRTGTGDLPRNHCALQRGAIGYPQFAWAKRVQDIRSC